MSWSGFWISGLILQLLFQPLPAAGAAAARLTCSAALQPDGSVKFQLSSPPRPRPASCNTNWEDSKRIVVAQGSEFNPDLVQNLTDQSITLRDCLDYLRYTRDCKVWEETVCRVNCSLHVVQDLPPPARNSTCPPGSPDHQTLGLGIAGVLLLFVGILVLLWFWRKKRSAATTASYTAAATAPQKDVV